MHTVHSDTIGQAWLSAIKTVIEYGSHVDNTTELIDLFIEVNRFPADDQILKQHADPDMTDWMITKNFEGRKPVLNWGYSYGMRFHDFNGIDQIETIVNKLASDPSSRSATISLVMPESDHAGHMPCITTLDFKLREGILYVAGFFRSQDVGKKLYADILAIHSIQKSIANKIKVDTGHVKVFITSAHIYDVDLEKVKTISQSL